ncbi:MAG: deoxyribodipyrimidine photo-lyase [Rickettsiales bacterium]|nr:deoxyribodipyrimidine photo-lyase [Rickettsiales bacterium]MCA0254252.1 DNA photolyase family protein [Pseudomonadota bacterium]
MQTSVIIWFRNDLRLEDNPALSYAAALNLPLIPLYIWDSNLSNKLIGSAQKWWLHHSLLSLKASLKNYSLDLVLRRGNPKDILNEVIKLSGAKFLVWNRVYEPDSIARDASIKDYFIKQGIEVKTFNGALLFEPWEIKNNAGENYKVFTPYWRYCLTKEPRKVLAIPKMPAQQSLQIKSDDINDWKLTPYLPNWAADFERSWSPGEASAKLKLNTFTDTVINSYSLARDFPADNGTSKLSPHLHFGEISPNQTWYALHNLADKKGYNANIEKYLAELGWREFSYNLLYHYPKMDLEPINKKFIKFPWGFDQKKFDAWKKGNTGYPIVDAGMRELWSSGWMHNRVRMIVASFLTKHLLIHWHYGAMWFFDTLLDADFANNSASWQWVGGCGADAAPYYRIFNPILQGQKFDPKGEYVRKWIPEISHLPDNIIHTPWKHSFALDYVNPIVDHDQARQKALNCYKSFLIN